MTKTAAAQAHIAHIREYPLGRGGWGGLRQGQTLLNRSDIYSVQSQAREFSGVWCVLCTSRTR